MRSTFLGVTFLLVTFLLATTTASTGEIRPAEQFVRTLKNAKEWELFSLDPSVKTDKDGFHGYKVLGKTTVKDPETLKGLFAAFKQGTEKGDAGDFKPRHGIRFTIGATTMDLLVCSPAKVYRKDTFDAEFRISKSPQAAFDKVLKAAGVELAKPVEK